ncbi:hypothetical protein JCM6882_006309 [Rhodosporidiobolus microsporus]
MAGFREEDDADIGDLLNPSAAAFGGSSTYSAFGAPAPSDDDLDTNPFAANPFADLASSSAALPYSPQASEQSPFYSEPPASTSSEPFYEPPESAYESAYQSQRFEQHDDEPQTPFQAEEPLPPPVPTVYSGEPSTPVSPGLSAPPRSFARESAPEPETPAVSHFHQYQQRSPPRAPPQPQHAPGDPDAFTYNPYASSPPRSSFYSPSSPTSDMSAGFPSSPARTREKTRPDLSALLGGDDKPKTPSFKRDGGGGGAGMSKSAILPGRESIGRKPVGGALAALLGMGGEEESKGDKEGKPRPAASIARQIKPEPLKAPEPPAPAPVKEEEKEVKVEPEDAPLPPDEPPAATEPPASTALETPLPPSRSATPAATEPSSTLEPKPTLARTFSEAPSSASTESAGINVGYDAMVSPLETGETPREDGRPGGAWPANKPVAEASGLDEQLASLQIDTATPSPSASTVSTLAPTAAAPSPTSTTATEPSAALADSTYQQYIFRDDASTTEEDSSRRPSSTIDTAVPSAEGSGFSSTTSSSRGFRAFNGSGDEGGFGGGGGGFGADDADSLRGTYSRSVEVGEEGEGETETGVSTPATERTIAVPVGQVEEQLQRKEREGSAPLPPLPAHVPSIQGSPRSTELGGSLGPTFIISVGDPQTVGSALNPTAQHTVYTVRTRTTSSAYRKSDFAVLRRYSHFVWLYEALLQNNPGVIVPGMPEKHAIGRFGSEFVENRRLGLQAALNKIVSHPMLVGDPDLRLFLESDTFHIDIKQRKIDTTSTENKGFLANLSSSISGPKFVEHDEYFEHRKQQLDVFETQLRSLLTSFHNAAKARATLHASIAELQSAFLALAQCDLSSTVRKLFDQAAGVQRRIYELAEAQMAHEEQIGGLVNVAESYARLCASAKGVFGARIKAYHHWQAAESNLRKLATQHDKAKKAGRTHSELLNLSVAEIADDGSLRIIFGNQAERKMLDAKHDFDDVSKLTKAEMARVDKEKVDDFKKALEDFADSMAARQRLVVDAWQQYHDLLAKAVEANANPPPSSSAASDTTAASS